MRILVPVDGTPECEIPIPLAQQLASAVDAEIYLLRVVEVADASRPLRSDPKILRMIDDAKTYLAELACRFELPANRTQCLVYGSDKVIKEIIYVVVNKGIDLIIMASRCKGSLQWLVQGSVCNLVVCSKVCPVLCVPLPRAQASRRHHAVAATRP